MIAVRRGSADDLAAIAAIQSASPEAAHWDPADYLTYDLSVAVVDHAVAGFLAGRDLAGIEYEILNLAVAPEWRRQGVAKALLSELVTRWRGTIFLEVRASNSAAIELYNTFGFQQLSRREEYYQNPLEAAIVMNFHSC